MADGSAHPIFYGDPTHQRTLAPRLWARPQPLMGFDHDAYLQNAHIQTHLRFFVESGAHRSSLRLNPAHEALAWSLAIHEAAHAEVEQVVAFAAHDGAVLQQQGATKTSQFLLSALDDIRTARQLGKFLQICALDTVRAASALSSLHNGDMDERGNRIGQFMGKRVVLVPCELKSEGGMEFTSDATVYTTHPSQVHLDGQGRLHVGISWVGADIPAERVDPALVARLVGVRFCGKTKVEIDLVDGMLRTRLVSGVPTSLLDGVFDTKAGGSPLRFFEPPAAKLSVKAPMQTLSGNEKTMAHAGHSEAMGLHDTAMIQLMPLFSFNGRRSTTGTVVEHPGGGLLRTLHLCRESEQKLWRQGRETPYGVAAGSILVQGPTAAELPQMSFDHAFILNQLALATCLEDILVRTRPTEASKPFREALLEMITHLVEMAGPMFTQRWNEARWTAIQPNAPRGIPFANHELRAFLDRSRREPSQAVDQLLLQAGYTGGRYLAVEPINIPLCLHVQHEAVQQALDEVSQVVDMRGLLQAVARLSEIRHQHRAIL